MLVPISIDVSDLQDEFSLTPKNVEDRLDSIVKQVTSRFYEEWVKEAKNSLGSSRVQYTRGLIVVDEGRLKGSVVLTGVVNNMIEQGVAAFDMKEGFKNSPKVKHTKSGGWYLTIPFRHATAGAGGFSEIFSNILPKPVQKALQEKIKSSGNPKASLRKSDIPLQYAIPKVRGEFSDVVNKAKSQFESYTHRSSIYEGLTRKADPVTGQGQYMTFRRVSNNSDPNAFIHTGIMARNLAEKTYSRFEGQISKEIDNSIDNFLNTL